MWSHRDHDQVYFALSTSLSGESLLFFLAIERGNFSMLNHLQLDMQLHRLTANSLLGSSSLLHEQATRHAAPFSLQTHCLVHPSHCFMNRQLDMQFHRLTANSLLGSSFSLLHEQATRHAAPSAHCKLIAWFILLIAS